MRVRNSRRRSDRWPGPRACRPRLLSLSPDGLRHRGEYAPGLTDAAAEDSRLRRKVSGAYNLTMKPVIGRVLAIPLLVLLSPVLIAISLAVVVDSGFPVFYRGERGGWRGKPFRIYKFRTMVRDADRIGGGTTALSDPRITRVGALLRKRKLDEFPQLINIVRGDMCFVGPRPELPSYTSQYAGFEKYILQVRPGITDFSSIEYINLDEVVGGEDADAVYEREVLRHKNELRIKYVAEMSPLTDLCLFVATVIRAAGGFVPQSGGRRAAHGDY